MCVCGGGGGGGGWELQSFLISTFNNIERTGFVLECENWGRSDFKGVLSS